MVKAIWKREPGKTCFLLLYSLESIGHHEAELCWRRDVGPFFPEKPFQRSWETTCLFHSNVQLEPQTAGPVIAVATLLWPLCSVRAGLGLGLPSESRFLVKMG
jgi:hypothetical protein